MEYGKHMEKRLEGRVKRGVGMGVKILVAVVAGIAFALLACYVLMLLWNWLMPYLFGVPLVTFWQAAGILLLAKLIFGIHSHGKPGGSSRTRRGNRKCADWKFEKDRWSHYDAFWKEEGAAAFKNYVTRKEQEADDTGAIDHTAAH